MLKKHWSQLSVVKTNQAFKGYAMSYKVELFDRKASIWQLKESKSSIKDLFRDLLNEIKGFKYQITVKVLLKKYTLNEEIEFAPVYFNSLTKTVKNPKFILGSSFQEILYMTDVWLMIDLAATLNQSSLNTLTFWLIDLHQEVFIRTYLLN